MGAAIHVKPPPQLWAQLDRAIGGKAHMNRGEVRAIKHRRLRRSFGKPREAIRYARAWAHGLRLVLLAAALLGGGWGWGAVTDDDDDDIAVTIADSDAGDVPDLLTARLDGVRDFAWCVMHGSRPAMTAWEMGGALEQCELSGDRGDQGLVGRLCRSNR
jgi:hypothetical protein